MKGTWRGLSLLLAVALSILALGPIAGADSGTEGDFLAKINSSRASAGLSPLSVDGGLRSYARKHTDAMIEAGEIFHSSSSQIAKAAGSGWDRLGENVGRGNSPSSLHEAFMASAGHKKNILGDYNYVGIGTGTRDGTLYVTVVFMKKGGGSKAETTTTTTSPNPDEEEVPAAEPRTAEPKPDKQETKASQAPATTTTTLPPTTTTTLVVGPDQPVTPGQSCIEAGPSGMLCHD